MNIGDVFTYIFKDKRWMNKLGIGILIMFVPILNFALTGYMIGIIENVMNRKPDPLPEWDNLGQKVIEGFKLALAKMVYSLPMVLFFCLPLSFLLVPAVISGNENLQDAGAVLFPIAGLLFIALMGLFFLYSMVLSTLYPAVDILYTRERKFSSCFKFREIYQLMRNNAASYFTTWLVAFGVGWGISMTIIPVTFFITWIPILGALASYIILIASSIFTLFFIAHLYGQLGALAFGQNVNSPNGPKTG